MLPEAGMIRIQRVRCKSCHKTTNVLPSFLLARKPYAVTALKELIITYIQQPEQWKRSPNLIIDISTAYRWLRILSQQANQSLPQIRKALLKLVPEYKISDHLSGRPTSLTSKRTLLKRLITLNARLFKAVVRLLEDKALVTEDAFGFLNYFLATQTANALLQS